MNTSIPHPIPYQGSKRRLADNILSYFPSEIDNLVEPFSGSAAVSLAAARRGKASHFVINDINAPLIDLWRMIVFDPVNLIEQYTAIWEAQSGHEKEFYFFIRDRFNKEYQPSDFLFLLARCVKAAVRYNSLGEFNQSPDNRRRGTHPQKMSQNIRQASTLLRERVAFSDCDYREILQNVSESDLIYMDPPYQGVCANRDPRYSGRLQHDEFVETVADLVSRRLLFIISYDGRTGTRRHGEMLPESLGLTHFEINAGRSSQETLLGRNNITYESLYLSPALINRLNRNRISAAHELRK